MTAPETTACWLCGAAGAPDPALGNAGFSRCPECGFLFQPSRASAEEEARRYDAGYFEEYAERGGGEGHYDDDDAQRRLEARARVRFVGRWAPPGALIEIGAASGYFIDAARTQGWSAEGVEPAGDMALRARERGLPVRQGTLATAAQSMEPVDLLCAWHVLEHLPEPRAAVGLMRRLLRPGGRLVLELPNVASVLAARRTTRWLHLDPGAHVAHYGPRQVRQLLSAGGFDVDHLETFSMREFVSSPTKRALHVVRDTVVLRTPAATHPTRHELMRVVARRPPDPA